MPCEATQEENCNNESGGISEDILQHSTVNGLESDELSRDRREGESNGGAWMVGRITYELLEGNTLLHLPKSGGMSIHMAF